MGTAADSLSGLQKGRDLDDRLVMAASLVGSSGKAVREPGNILWFIKRRERKRRKGKKEREGKRREDEEEREPKTEIEMKREKKKDRNIDTSG